MKRFWALILVTILSLSVGNATACRIAGKVWPTSTELAATSELVFIVHVDHVRPLGKSDAEFLQRFPSNVVSGVPFEFPEASAEFSVLRSLKDSVPTPTLMKSATHNCSGVHLEPDADYLIFANMPDKAGADIAPIKGSFKLDESQQNQSELRTIEAVLTTRTSVNP